MQIADARGVLPFLSACEQGRGTVIREFLKFFTEPILLDREEEVFLDEDDVSKGNRIAERAPAGAGPVSDSGADPVIVLVGTANSAERTGAAMETRKATGASRASSRGGSKILSGDPAGSPHTYSYSDVDAVLKACQPSPRYGEDGSLPSHPLCDVLGLGDVVLEETNESHFSTAFVFVEEGALLTVPRRGFLVEISVGKNAHGILKPRFDSLLANCQGVLGGPRKNSSAENGSASFEGSASVEAVGTSASDSGAAAEAQKPTAFFLYKQSSRVYKPVCELTKSCTCVPRERLKILPLPDPGSLHYAPSSLTLQRLGQDLPEDVDEDDAIGIDPGNLLYFQNAPVSADSSNDADALPVCAGETYLYVENLLELTEQMVLVRGSSSSSPHPPSPGKKTSAVDGGALRGFMRDGKAVARYARDHDSPLVGRAPKNFGKATLGVAKGGAGGEQGGLLNSSTEGNSTQQGRAAGTNEFPVVLML